MLEHLSIVAGIITSLVGSYVAWRKLHPQKETPPDNQKSPLKIDMLIFGYRLRLERVKV